MQEDLACATHAFAQQRSTIILQTQADSFVLSHFDLEEDLKRTLSG